MNNVRKWAPVLRKCKEFTEDQHELIAGVLENQFQHWTQYTEPRDIADFIRFALPVSRRVLGRLLGEGFEVNVVSPEVGETFDLVQLGSVTPTEVELASEFVNAMDREACLCDLIADQIMTNIEEIVPEKKLELYLLLVVNPKVNFANSLGSARFFGKIRKAQ